MNTRWIIAGSMALAMVAGMTPARAQSLQDRIKNVREKQQREVAVAQVRAAQKLAVALPTAQLEDITAKEAFEWLQVAGQVPIVVNWNSLAALGIDEHSRVRLITQGLTVGRALQVLTQQLSVDGELIIEPTPWYVEVMTKEQANRRPVTLVYPIGDMLHEIPRFDDAPEFDLAAISSGGGSGGGGQSPFSESSSEDKGKSKAEHAQEIANLIRDTIEPDIWRQNGGLAGSIAVYRESLVIRAPAYVHRQIGGYSPTPDASGIEGAAAGAAGAMAPAQRALPQGKLNVNQLVKRPGVKAEALAAAKAKADVVTPKVATKSTRDANTHVHATSTEVPVSLTRPDAR
ncbi:MAG: hypothetical protein GC159_21405 [Phycisphaera sp.]|nr:hypothetical protein [Phycisphaera sp.]